jgi:putative transposase
MASIKLFATRHSHAKLYVHAVWSTKNRIPVLDNDILARLAKQAEETAHALGGAVLAFGGAEDHVHVLLRYRPDLPVSRMVRGLKSALTLAIRRDDARYPDFAWQTGYGAFSVSISDIGRVVSYISNQAHHHDTGTVWPEIELID